MIIVHITRIIISCLRFKRKEISDDKCVKTIAGRYKKRMGRSLFERFARTLR